jgi:hypothetical protein
VNVRAPRNHGQGFFSTARIALVLLPLVPGGPAVSAGFALAAPPLTPGAATAEQEPEGKKPPVRKAWSLRLGLDQRYDDNILQLSDRDLDRLQNPRPSDAAANRFSIRTPDDFISMPRVSPGFKADWWRGRPTSFALEISASQYLRNSIKNYQTYRLSIAQALRGGEFHETSVAVAYGLRPHYYLRNLISDRHLEELGFIPTPIPRLEAAYRRDYLQIEVEQEIVKERLTFRGLWGREHRDYNRNFDERDSQMPYREAALRWTPYRDGRLRLRVSYRREDQHSGGDLADTPSFLEDDISSRRDVGEADLRLRWGARGRKKTIMFDYEDERREYSTTNTFDAFHFDRRDSRRYATLSFRADLKEGWFLAGAAQRDTNRSKFPAAVSSTVPPDDITDYTENQVQVGLGYDFGSAPSTAGRPRTPTD